MDKTIQLENLKELTEIKHLYLFKIVFLIGTYLLAVFTTVYCINSFPACRVFLTIPLYILAGASLHAICLFTHEGVHGTLHKNIWINNLIGSLSGFIVLQTLAGYRVLHLKHHKYLNIDGDPGLLTTYVTNKYIIAAMEWGYFFFGYLAFLTIIPYQGFKLGRTHDKALIVRDMFCIGLVVWLSIAFLPINWLIHGWLIPMVFVHFMMNIRGMSQHLMLENHHDPYNGARTIVAHPIVDFFLCNENYHIEHHLYPNVPWYNLKKVHALIKDNLKEKNSTVIFSFREFVLQFIKKSLRAMQS